MYHYGQKIFYILIYILYFILTYILSAKQSWNPWLGITSNHRFV